MINEIKVALKKTWMYAPYRLLRSRRRAKCITRLRSWDSVDETRAAFYEQFIGSGDLVFDVGANQGNRAKVFSKLQARVVAFEPQRYCYEILTTLFEQNDTIRLVNKALGAEEGIADMYVSDVNVLSSLSPSWISAMQGSGRFKNVAWNKTERVEITTLDSAIREYGTPRFIKVDVEGYEFEVLSGLSTPIECISIEFVPERIHEAYKCIDRMEMLSSIEIRLSLGESMSFATRSWLPSHEIKKALAEIPSHEFGDLYIRSIDKSGKNWPALES